MFHGTTLYRAMRLAFSEKHYSLRHAAYCVGFMHLFFMLRIPVAMAQALDHIVFPRFRQQKVRAPLYIIANPRSGTTLLYRLLCLDEQFTYVKLYQTVLPSILFYRFVAVLASIDSKMGNNLHRMVKWFDRHAFNGWKGIHPMGFNEAEEDEGVFVHTLLTPAIALLFPYLNELNYLKFVDDLPAPTRERLMRYYENVLKRHVYVWGDTMLRGIKSVLSAGRMRSMMRVFPDMRIVYLVRHPYQAIPSLLSMFDVVWETCSPHLRTSACRDLGQLALDYYQYLEELKKTLPPSQFIDVRYDDLVADPLRTIERIYARLGLTLTREYRERLLAEIATLRGYASAHHYKLEDYGLNRNIIYQRLRGIFESYGFER